MKTSSDTTLKKDIRAQAERLSANCFFNALLREWDGWSLHRIKTALSGKTASSYGSFFPIIPAETEAVITLPIGDNSLLISLSHFSISGRHQLTFPIFLFNEHRRQYQEVSFANAVERLISADQLWKNDPETRNHFLKRVLASIENIQSTLQYRHNDLAHLFDKDTDFQLSEQSLITGHSVHPTPKSREQFSDQDAERYMPEYGNAFKLHWFSIRSALLIDDSVHSLSFKELTLSLAEEDVQFPQSLLNDIPPDHTLLPAHPWQANRWLENTYIKDLISSHQMIDFGVFGSEWRATSSVRAIHSKHASFMLKYSLSVKLTNSVRHLLPKEVIRGKEIHQVKYHTAIGQRMKLLYPNFEILTEPAHAAIIDENGQPLPETMIVFRENPFNKDDINQSTELLATLTQDNPSGESRLINLVRKLAVKESLPPETIVKKWFQKYLTAVVKPLVGGQSNFGLLFGAHQQNLLLNMPDGYPETVYFRDCQGTGYSHLARELLTKIMDETSEEQEHYVDEFLGNRLFTYYLIINSTFGVISALGAANLLPEEKLLQDLKAFLESMRQAKPADSSCLDYILDSHELWSKGNFYCSYCAINENTLDNPMGVYHTMKNPLHC